MVIRHKGGDLIGVLAQALHPHDQEVIARSTTVGALEKVADSIDLAAETPEARLLCFRSSEYDVQILVEPLQGSIRSACDTVWTAAHRSAREFDPSLRSLVVLDGTTGRELAVAGVGFATGLASRRDLWLALIIGFAGLIVFAIAAAIGSAKTITSVGIGSLPGVVGGIVASVSLVLDASNKNLVWRA
jgi:hypothetical protein